MISVFLASRLDVGSSARMIGLEEANALARLTRWSSPPESVRARSSARLSSPTSSSALRARSLARSGSRPSLSGAIMTLSRAVLAPRQLDPWGTQATRLVRGREVDKSEVERRVIVPDDGAIKPPIAARSVDFPLPDGPTRAPTRPGEKTAEKPDMTVRSPNAQATPSRSTSTDFMRRSRGQSRAVRSGCGGSIDR